MRRAARLLRPVAAWGVAVLLLWLAFRSVEWGAVGDAVRPAVSAGGLSTGPVLLALAAGLNLSILALWSLQWRLFAEPPGDGDAPPFRRVFEVVAVMSTVSNSVPFLAGQATGVHLLATRGGTGHARALSVFALDQLAEGVAKLSLLALLAVLAPLPPRLETAAATVAGGVAVLAVALALASALRARGGRARLLSRRRVPARARRFLGHFADGLHSLRSPGVLAGAIGLALAMKAAEGGAIVAVQHALGVELPLWATLLVLASVGLATMVAVAPANLGVYEASAFAAYRLAGVDPGTAAALALLQHALFLVAAAGPGALVMARAGLGSETWLRRSRPRASEATLEAGAS